MSPVNQEPVDTDLLADHLGGALAGTPDEARVAHLIATDPGWARAAGQLASALDSVATDLAAVGPPPAMPDDVAARLDAVLHSLSPAASEGIAAAPHPSGQRPLDGRPADRRRRLGDSGPARTRRHGDSGPARTRRRTRWGAALAGLAAVVAFAAIGLGPLGLAGNLSGEAEDAGAGDTAEAPAAAGEDDSAEALDQEAAPGTTNAERDGAGPVIAASGLNYVPDSPLFALPGGLVPDIAVAPEVQPERPDERLPADGEVPEELAPLWAVPDPCLRAVQAAYRPAPVEIQLVDFADFQGAPALVIWLTAGDRHEALVAGPDCGQPAAGLDERYRTELD